MLKFALLHPTLIAALASAGHGSKILIADANYPCATRANPAATLVFLNLRPGLIDVDEILATIIESVPLESAAVMVPQNGPPVSAHEGYRERLGPGVPFDKLGRPEFYEASRSRDVAVVVASADQRVFANLLLTIGVRAG
jgi:L-fucose mutarotase